MYLNFRAKNQCSKLSFKYCQFLARKFKYFQFPRKWIFMFWRFLTTLSTLLIPNSWFYSVYSCNPTFDPDPVYSRIAQPLRSGGGQKILNWNLFNGPYLCEIDFRCKRPTANLYMDKPKETHSTHSNNNSQFSPYHRTGAWQQQTLHVHYQGGNIISLRRTLPSMLCTCLTSMLSYAFFLDIFHP